MIRKIASTTLLVSFVALASSGMMMMVIDTFEFQLRMHPVHKLFGIAMVVSGLVHVYLNFKSIKKYLSSRKVLIYGVVLVVFMFLLYFAGFKKPIDQSVIKDVEVGVSMLQKEK